MVEGGKTQMLEPQHFSNESLLQDILEKFPEVIALDELGVTEPFLVIGREVATPAGYIDVLCIDGGGVLTVIETKLARNSQIRREVVGQVLEYVAQVSKWNAKKVESVANQYLRSTNIKDDLIDRLGKPNDEIEGSSPSNIYDMIDDNLSKGRIKVVIASDSIPDILRDTVSFINSFSNFEIFVMQVKSYMQGDMQIYAPTVFGLTRRVPTGPEREKTQWDEESFFNATSHLSQDKIDAIRSIYEFSKTSGVKWGIGKVTATFSHMADVLGRRIAIFFVSSNGNLIVNFGNLRYIDIEKRTAFKNTLNRIPGVSFTDEAVIEDRYPKFSVSLLIRSENLAIFKSAVTGLVDSLETEMREPARLEKYDDNKFSGDINVHIERNPSKDITLSEDDERVLDKAWADVAKTHMKEEPE